VILDLGPRFGGSVCGLSERWLEVLQSRFIRIALIRIRRDAIGAVSASDQHGG
jgi:hypothetical protein